MTYKDNGFSMKMQAIPRYQTYTCIMRLFSLQTHQNKKAHKNKMPIDPSPKYTSVFSFKSVRSCTTVIYLSFLPILHCKNTFCPPISGRFIVDLHDCLITKDREPPVLLQAGSKAQPAGFPSIFCTRSTWQAPDSPAETVPGTVLFLP